MAIAPVREALAAARTYLKRFAAALQPHRSNGTWLNFAGDVNDSATVLRTALSAERFDRLVSAKHTFDADNRLRFSYPL